MSVMTIAAIVLLVIGPLPWFIILIVVGRELRWHVQDKEEQEPVSSGYSSLATFLRWRSSSLLFAAVCIAAQVR